MASVRLKDVKNHVLQGINLTIKDGELLVIVGPSGAGKSTLLHTIAGLLPYRGRVLFDNRPVDSLSPHERQIGVVFQDLFLFPHLTVQGNLALGMKHLCLKRRVEKEKTGDLLVRFGLQHLARRHPGQLSGGEKQRVALARALAGSPRLLLLDEPLSSLDVSSARTLRGELLRFHKERKITSILVTHNMEEAAALGDRIGVIRNGNLIMAGTPYELAAGNLV
jgi:ABC-type sugar transport system ATPase subunit